MQTEVESYTKGDVLDWLEDKETLEYADLHGSRLVGIYLPKVNLKGADLSAADLRYANLTGVILEDANLQNANLMGVKLRGANLSGANLENAFLDNADLLKADLRRTCFKNAKLTYVSMRSVDISEADFSGADLRNVNLGGAKGCLKAKFDNADLRGARVEYTVLDKVTLEKVGAKVDGSTKGLKVHVFDFIEVDDTTPGLIKRIFRRIRSH